MYFIMQTNHTKLQQELRNEELNTILQRKALTRLRSTVKSPTTNVESRFSKKAILQRSSNDAAIIRDESKTEKLFWLLRTVGWLSNGLTV